MNALQAFFYNLIPGTLFLIILQKITNFSPPELKTEEYFYLILVLSLTLGFGFQAVTKFIRNIGLNKETWKAVVDKDPDSLKIANKILRKMKLFTGKIEEKHYQRVFYLMHNYVWGGMKCEGPIFFTHRLAFWSNICVASLVLSFIAFTYNEWCAFFILLSIIIISALLTWSYIKTLYDVVLKTFVSIAEQKYRDN